MRVRFTPQIAVLAVAGALAAGCVAPPPKAINTSVPTVTAVPIPSSSTSDVGARLLAEARNFVYRARNVPCLATGSSILTTEGILTNRHVASGASSLQMSTWDGTDFDAVVRSISGGPDLALLTTDRPSETAPTIRTARVAGGTAVWAAGYPEGDQLSVKPGIVLDYVDGARYGEPGQVMEITNGVQPGNSGGPLFDSQGRVVGVIVAIETATGDALAIPASTAVQYLANPDTNTLGECIA